MNQEKNIVLQSSSQESYSSSEATLSVKNDDLSKAESLNVTPVEVHAPNYNDDPNNPMNWPQRKKIATLIGISLNSFMGFFASAIYMPAVGDIMTYFKTNLTVINATIALYLVMNAIAPLFWAPLSERIGRRWIYIVCLVLFGVCSVVCGVSTNIGLFFAFRLLQAAFGAAAQSVGGGTISDLFDFKDRGKAMGVFMLGTIIGPSIAPVCGGYIDQNLGWRWIFYIKAIISGGLAISSFFLVPETLYNPNSQNEVAPKGFKQRLQRMKFNPFTCFELLMLPENALVCLAVSVGFGWFYFLASILSPTFADVYEFSTGTIGLCFLAGGVGNILCTVFYGSTSDRINKFFVKRNNGVRIPEYHLIFNFIGLPFMILGALLYGWLLHSHAYFMGPLVAYGIFNFGMMMTISATNTYMVELNTGKAASAISLSNFTRSIFGMIFTLAAVQIRGSLGDGWSYTLAALMILVAYLGCNLAVRILGPKWRKNRQARLQERS